jgi:ferredoxin-thioredoxin reductase catalytic subunit/rubredoxin
MDERVQKRVGKLKADAAAGGYTLNPDDEFVADLAAGMMANEERYGMESCPCRLFEGEKEDNIDIVCPCVYRDDDLAEYGACFCALYVAQGRPVKQAPERRLPLEQRRAQRREPKNASGDQPGAFAQKPLAYPVYRCSVCGYLCANTNPPRVCPVCKAGAERFERFI